VLRRSYASLRCACGDDVRYTADQLGHEDPRFTLAVYAKATKRRNRTYAAFLAGTNRMRWPRFLVFNAAGGITWALVIGLAYYYLGSAVAHLRGPLDIILVAVAVIVVIGFLIYLHKTEDRFSARAEQAFPGELPES
jgi:hypothetical protein